MLQGNEHSRSWVSGSPRPNGNTDTIVRAALDHIQQLEGGTTEFFGLGGKSVNYCTGCVDICHPGYGDAGAKPKDPPTGPPGALCRRHDDAIKEVLAKMAKADAILIASPVYLRNVTGVLKTLMDRSTAMINADKNGCYRSPFENKIGAAIAVGAARHGG